jgi:soluble cytochrome b562
MVVVMADVDITSLSVEISAESQGAELNIDKLATAISNLRTKGNVSKVIDGLDKLTNSLTALKSAQGDFSGLESVTRFIDGISKVNASESAKGISTLAKSIAKLPESLTGMGTLSDSVDTLIDVTDAFDLMATVQDPKGLKSAINAIKKIPEAVSGVQGIGSDIGDVKSVLNGFNNLPSVTAPEGLSSFVSLLRRIPKAVSEANKADYTQLAESSRQLMNGLAPLSVLDFSNLKNLGSVLNQLNKIPDLAQKLDSKTVGDFSSACQKLYTALTPLASQLDKVGNAFAKLPPQLSKVVTQANRVTAANEKQRKSYLSLSNQMNGFMRNMAKLVSLKAIAEYLGNAVAKFNDFYEATDLFHNAMGNLSGEADTLISKMQGLLGVDPTKAMTYMATIQSLGTSFGLASDKAYILSKNLTQLAYDEGSYWNKDVAETFTAMSSAISGEIEPIRRLGIDLTQARLQQELLALGFNKQVSSLSQADKAVLRYIAIMKQTANVQGNLAQTIQSPANQIKILKAQLDMLAKSVGSLLYPALKSILPPLIAAVQLIREFVEWVAKLMGVKVVFTDFTKSADSVGGIGDAMDDTADSTKKAAKALKDYTMGFDELNIIDPTQGSSGSGSGASAGNILGDVDLSGYDMFKNYVGTSVDEIKEKIRGLLPLIESIAAAFALWELGKFIKQIGEVITGMNGIQKAAAMIAILVVEWALVQKFSDDFLKTGDTTKLFFEWLATVAAAIGGYAFFGAEGASIAFVVSSVVQLESIKTNLAEGKVKATDASVWMQGISAAVTTGIAGAIFTKTATGFTLGLSVGAVLALSAITYGGTKGGSIKPGDSIDMLLTALTAAAGGLAGVTLALAAGVSAPIAGAALILGVGVGIVLEQLGITFGEKDRIKEVEDYIKRYEEAGYTTLAIHYRLKNLGFSEEEVQMAEGGIDSTFELLRYTFNKKLEALNDWFSEKWAGFKENFSKAWNSLSEAVSSAEESLNQASADLKQWFVGVGEWWNQKWAGFKENWDKAWNSLVDTIKNLPTKFLDYGKNIVHGLIDGINNGIENAKKTVGGLAKAIIDKFTTETDIHSPSKVFERFGIYIAQGLANGIASARGYVDEAMQGLINGVTNAGNQFIEQGKQTGIGFVNSLDQTLTSTWQQLDTNLQNDFLGTIQNLWEAAQSGDVKTIGTTIAAVLWHAMGEEQRTQIKTIATDMITDLSTQLTNALSTLSAQAYQIGGELLNGITSKFGEILQKTKQLGGSLSSTFQAVRGPLKSVATAISAALSGGLASAFPTIYASMGTLIGTIGASFVAMLHAIGAALSATIFGIPAGLVALGAAAVLAASIAGITGSLGGKKSSSSSSYGDTGYNESDLSNIDYSNVPGTSQYNDVNSGVQSSYAASTTQISAEEIREAVYNGAYNALLDYKQRYDQGDKDNILKVYLDGKQLTATVEKRKNERGRSIMGTEAYSY